jgi:carbon storage regulator
MMTSEGTEPYWCHQGSKRSLLHMLVLTRSVGERLIINNGEIKLSVLEIKGNQVRIGIDAPKKVAIHREEIFNRIKKSEEEAA